MSGWPALDPPQSNLLLDLLTPADRRSLGRAEDVELPIRKRLDGNDDQGRYAYFLTDGVASLVTSVSPLEPIEIGIIGFEGTTSLSTIYGDGETPYQIFMQIPGRAKRFEAIALREAIDSRPDARRVMLRYARAFSIQVATTALANAKSTIVARLARWILMSSDRVGPKIGITHEFLSDMLGVRRSGVTVAMHTLEGLGCTRSERGAVTVANRARLIDAAKGAYGFAESEYARLLRPSVKS